MPQLSVQQLEHAIKVFKARVSAKKLEIHSYSQFKDNAPVAAIQLLGADPLGQGMHDAVENFFTAKMNQALLDLEELELQVKALRQARSGIIILR